MHMCIFVCENFIMKLIHKIILKIKRMGYLLSTQHQQVLEQGDAAFRLLFPQSREESPTSQL